MDGDPVRYDIPRSAAAAGDARRQLRERLNGQVGARTLGDAQIVLTEILGPWVSDGARTEDIAVEAVAHDGGLRVTVAHLGVRLVRAVLADDLRLSVIRGVARDWGVGRGRDPVFWFEVAPAA